MLLVQPCSASLPGGHLVDGLPPVVSSDWLRDTAGHDITGDIVWLPLQATYVAGEYMGLLE